MMRVVRAVIILAGLLALWEAVTWATDMPHFLLPAPHRVLETLVAKFPLLATHAGITLSEILLASLVSVVLGGGLALTLVFFRPARRWLLPVLVATQAIPVFAIAPLMVLWFGYGLASKVATAALVVFFPVTLTFFDGLRRIEPGWLDLARSMNATPAAILWRIRLPAALPALASGLRMAAVVAPIGAVIGEWVGSGAGLGYLMLHANGRMQTDLMFAALTLLAAITVALYYAADAAVRRLTPWISETYS